MDECKCLKKAARREKRRFVTLWKVLSVLLLAAALVATPLSVAAKWFDNVVAAYLGDQLWETVNGDENAVYFPMDIASDAELQVHIRDLTAQVMAEGAVLLLNENNALPLSVGETIRAFGDTAMTLLPNAAEDGDVAVAVLNGEDTQLLQQLSQMKADGRIRKIIALLTSAQAEFFQENPYHIDAALWIGSAVASVEDLLTGRVNPSGSLPKAHSGGAFPFGFGLSYTTFTYSEMMVAYNEKTDRFAVTVTVANTGAAAGKETVQVYARFSDGTVKLAGFAKTAPLAPGESRKITVYADRKAFAAYEGDTCVLNPGEYALVVAADSRDAVAGELAYPWEQAEAVVFGSQTEAVQMAEEMPTMGAQNGLKLYDMLGVALRDPKWQTFLDQLTFEDMAAMLADAYGGFPAMESVQSPGIRSQREGLTGFPGGDVLAATFNTELAYEMGKAMGNHCLSQNIDCLYNPGGKLGDFSEDSFLAGKICANQVLGIQDKGVIAAMDLDGAQQAAVQYVLKEGKAGGVIADRNASLGDFAGMVISEKSGKETLLAGVTTFDSQLPWTHQLEAYRDDPAVVSVMRRACQYNLYTIVNSAAMNGFGKDTTVENILLPLVVICRAVAACSWVLVVIFTFLWARGKAKWKKTQTYLDYKTLKNTWKELKKTKKL